MKKKSIAPGEGFSISRKERNYLIIPTKKAAMHKKLIMQDSILKMAGFQKSHTQLNKEPYFGMERKKWAGGRSKVLYFFLQVTYLYVKREPIHRELAKGLRF